MPPHHDVTGAIGAALLAMRERDWETSKFKGFDLADRHYDVTSFECSGCPNHCEIRQVQIEGEKPLFYGSRCEKYEVAANQKKYDLPDLLKEREDWLYGPEPPKEGKRGPIGIPRTMFFQELMPFFRAFFEDLGFTVVYSQKTNKSVINQGVEALAAEPCYPVKVAHGHLLDLLKAGVKRIFLPSVIDIAHPHPEVQAGVVCPMVQSLCYTAPSAIDFGAYGAKVLSPVLYFGRGEKRLRQGLRDLGKELGVSAFAVNRAMHKAVAAQKAYFERLSARGREILDSLPPDGRLMVLIGRPYNALDPGMNLNLHRKLRQLGVLALPMDFLPVDQVEDLDEIKPMYWRFGQKILGVAELIRRDPRLYGVFITNFGCGPDSFIQHFFRDRMRGKPYLEIEIDEHSSDVGAITRLEAFLDSLKNVKVEAMPERVSPYRYRVTGNLKRKIYLPPMTDHALAIVAAFQACGGEAEALPDSDEETLELGRRLTSGKECYPLILTTGDLAKLLQRPDFDPDQSAFFMPSANGPCRFGQYHRFHRLVLDDLGYPQVPVYSPEQSENMYREVGMVGGDFDRIAWNGIVAIDLLEKKLRECRPYERQAGETDQVYQHYLQKVYEALRDRQDVAGPLRQARGAFDDLALEHQRPEAHRRHRRRDLHPGQPVLQRKRGAGDRGPGRRGLDAAHRRVAPLRHPLLQARRPGGPPLPPAAADHHQGRDSKERRTPPGGVLPRQHQEPEGALHRRDPGAGRRLPAPLLRRRGHPEHGQIPGLRAQGRGRPGEHHALHLHARHRGQLPVQALPGGPRQYPLPEPGLRRPGTEPHPHPPGGLHVPGAPVPGAAEVGRKIGGGARADGPYPFPKPPSPTPIRIVGARCAVLLPGSRNS